MQNARHTKGAANTAARMEVTNAQTKKAPKAKPKRKRQSKTKSAVRDISNIGYATANTIQGQTLSYDTVADEVDNGELSDGGSALRDVLRKEKNGPHCRGLQNQSIKWFHSPLPVVDDEGQTMWKFICCHCGW